MKPSNIKSKMMRAVISKVGNVWLYDTVGDLYDAFVDEPTLFGNTNQVLAEFDMLQAIRLVVAEAEEHDCTLVHSEFRAVTLCQKLERILSEWLLNSSPTYTQLQSGDDLTPEFAHAISCELRVEVFGWESELDLFRKCYDDLVGV